MSNFNYSFKQWCIDNNRQDILDRWDYEVNDCNPSDISFKSNNKYYFKCPEGLHPSKAYKICDLHKSKYPQMKCKQCNSLAQFIINKYDEDYLNKVWSSYNKVSPWNISVHSNTKYWFNCLDNPNHVYDMKPDHYANGIGCPYCSHHRINKENSLGMECPEVLEIWSDKNKCSPYEFAPHSSESVWWKCNSGIHKEYKRKITRSNTCGFICPECGKQQGWMNRKEDISGQVFGELTALRIDESKLDNKRRTYWICRCSCGATPSIDVTNLKTGNTTTCGDRMAHYSGENNGNWKGGVTAPLQIERTSSLYNTWRDSVYKKDWYTCQCCGKSKNINKNAHHIQNFLDNEDLRFDVNNGILLCDECHAITSSTSFHHRYGTRNNTPEQLEEYINIRRKELNINKPFKMINYLKGDKLKPNTVKIGE